MKFFSTSRLVTTLFTLSLTPLYALDFNSKNFAATFTQTVQDDNKKVLKYEGEIYAKYPNMSLWKYTTPIIKNIFIKERIVTIVEPELEQAIVQQMSNEVDILKLLKDATKITNEKYETTFNGVVYTINMKTTHKNETLPSTIAYQDKFDNTVTITFHDIDITHDINESTLKVDIPKEYDIISN